ncbi:MAG: serine protease [Candidatus Nealsonbacteria bacterium]|nr:serine protease [Candidatus Nealsonbacteria bacterium]
MSKKLLIIIGVFVVGIVGGIFADQILWPYFIERPLFYEYGLEKNPVYLTETNQVYIQENTALVEAVERVEKTVIGIKTKTKYGTIFQGSGLVVTSDGLMVTLAELVPQGATFSFFLDNKEVSFQVLKRDLQENLALLKLSDSSLTTTGFASLDKLKVGERVFLLGIVFGPVKDGVQQVGQSVNEGIIKSFDQDLIETNIIETGFLDGSPLFNIKGEIIGLNTIDSRGNVSAIPISKIKVFMGM